MRNTGNELLCLVFPSANKQPSLLIFLLSRTPVSPTTPGTPNAKRIPVPTKERSLFLLLVTFHMTFPAISTLTASSKRREKRNLLRH
jgi:hypothetical protein